MTQEQYIKLYRLVKGKDNNNVARENAPSENIAINDPLTLTGNNLPPPME
ncbi:MAG: hypothetical protein K0R02_963 [Rickettsiaceae bacterium]|jgi:hypothetical protein|nr:hypothetical protein [Rickettsiaceae bacterium]